MELVELVRGAQDAMDRGDYRLATTASTHGLVAYPSCLAAHRILGEAYLELGSTDPATKHFEHTLAVDPLNVVARLGLGVASEEQKDYGAAYAHYLHAWEINPALDQVRDELVRLRGLLGVEDRLHPTRAGLAGIHARGGQLHRAANEWRAVLAVEPESRRARTSFAELLWRQGEDGPAAVAGRDALRGSPENARALAILADTERRRGGATADEFAERYRAVDPTGDVLKLLGEWRADVDLSFLVTASALVDDFDFSAHAVPADQLGAPPRISTNALAGNQIAAPDLWDTLVKDLSSELPSTGIAPTVAAGVEPFAWNDAGPDQSAPDQFADLGVQPFNVDDLGGPSDPAYFSFAEPAEVVSSVSTADIYTAALSKSPSIEPEPFARVSSIDEDDELAALFAPSTDREIADATPPAAASSQNGTNLWGGSGDGPQSTSVTADGFDDLADLGIEPFSFDGMPDLLPDIDDPASYAPRQAVAPAPQPATAPSPAPIAAAADIPAPTAAVEPDARPATAPVFVDPFVGADGKIDLTAGWDELDKSLAAATPSFEAVGHYDDLSAEIDLDGIVPFDADIPGEDEDAWAPLTEDDFGIQPAAVVDVVLSQLNTSADAVSEPPAPPVADWSTNDVAMASEQPSALDALMSLPTVDDLAAQATNLGETTANHVVAQVSDMDDLIGTELTAIPVTFDDEVIFGIPTQQASGYTELLRHVDIEEPDGEHAFHPDVDPFINPDSNGDPLAFEDLLAVTSRDGTAPLISHVPEPAEPLASPFDFSETDPSASIPADVDRLLASEMAELSLGEVNPFDVSELESTPVWADVEVDPATDPFAGMTSGIYTGILANDEMNEPRHADGLELTPFDFEAALAEAEAMEPAVDPVMPVAATDLTELVDSDETPMPGWSGSDGLGMTIGSVVWPAFVNQTSDLIDRDLGNGSVFTRLRAGKSQLVAAGQLVVDRRLVVPATSPPPVEILVEAIAQAEAPAAEIVDRRRQRPEMSEQTRLDLMAMRIRLIEDPDSYEEVATTVERAVGEGLADPLALRILGEAYLKLGKMEQAAAQFRQAMLARQRTR